MKYRILKAIPGLMHIKRVNPFEHNGRSWATYLKYDWAFVNHASEIVFTQDEANSYPRVFHYWNTYQRARADVEHYLGNLDAFFTNESAKLRFKGCKEP